MKPSINEQGRQCVADRGSVKGIRKERGGESNALQTRQLGCGSGQLANDGRREVIKDTGEEEEEVGVNFELIKSGTLLA